jgi:hypothetical protein
MGMFPLDVELVVHYPFDFVDLYHFSYSQGYYDKFVYNGYTQPHSRLFWQPPGLKIKISSIILRALLETFFS